MSRNPVGSAPVTGVALHLFLPLIYYFSFDSPPVAYARFLQFSFLSLYDSLSLSFRSRSLSISLFISSFILTSSLISSSVTYAFLSVIN
jgi:hypothetical protein